MKTYLTKFLLCSTCLFYSVSTLGQKDTEFKKGFIAHVRLHNGLITNFKYTPDTYIGGGQIIPQFTLIQNKIRGGLIAGFLLANKKLSGQLGATISIKLKTVKLGPLGSAANVHLSIDHIWSSEKEKLFGGGINIDVLNKIILGITAHRDYNFKTWWLQTAIGFRISKNKKVKEAFNN
jgi:hypothetical protein